MIVRHATKDDIDTIMEVYDQARQIMRQNGNMNQWINGFPQRHIVEEDVELQRNYCIVNDEGEICGVFALIFGEDPTYLKIYEGEWSNDKPYATIHRIGSTGKYPGVFKTCLEFCDGQIDTLRIDTHRDNTIMQHTVTKNGFEYCGIIYIADGTERLAYLRERP